MSPTIYDVANACGVASSTVSRAFSRPGRVNAATADRIRRVAAEMGYRSQPLPQAPHGGRTSMLAILIADVTNPFFFEIIRGAEEEASSAGYTLLVSDVRESVETERLALERTIPLVEGLVLSTSRMSDSAIRVSAKQRPTVVMNRPMTDVASVVTDNAGGMRRAVEHLLALGHKSLTYVSGPEASWADGMRWRTLRDVSLERGLRARRIGPFEPTIEGGQVSISSLAETTTTAVVAYNDLMAIGLMRALEERGVGVPEDVSVIGFDNIFGSDFCNPQLTTVAAPLRALGAYAVRTVVAQIRSGPPASFRPALLPAQLIVRGSTAPSLGAALSARRSAADSAAPNGRGMPLGLSA